MKTDKKIRVIPVEVYSRVCGFFRPTCNWNPGKLSEFHDRKMVDIKKSLKMEDEK